MPERDIQPTEVTCRLAAAVGGHERCPETLCAYWEQVEGDATGTGCGLHRIAPYLPTHPELARHLLELRARLEDVRGH